jgi:hypothetical protein
VVEPSILAALRERANHRPDETAFTGRASRKG